jgi:hypothetical protein
MADIDPPGAPPAPASPPPKGWAETADTALHYAAGAGLLLIAARLGVGQDIMSSLVLAAAAGVGFKMGGR